MNVKIELSETTTRQIKNYVYLMYIDDKSYIVNYEDNYENFAFCEVINGEWKQYIDVKEQTEIEQLTEIFLKAKRNETKD